MVQRRAGDYPHRPFVHAYMRRVGAVVPDNVAQKTLDAMNLKRAIELRVKGALWSEISDACGFASPAAALRAVGDAMADATQRAEETADMMRDTAQMRYESLLRDTLKMLAEDAPMDLEGNQADDRAVKLRAVDEARRLVESITKLQRLDKVAEEPDADSSAIRIIGVAVEDII